MELQNDLKVWRARKNITQEQLAREVGLSRQTIHSIEKGKFVPSVLSALKIAGFFKVPIEEIFFARSEDS